jgi:excisionase family DNA binding protein
MSLTAERRRERVRVDDAASILGISGRTVQALAARGEIPGAAKIGGLWTFDEAALRLWIRERSTCPKNQGLQSTPTGGETRFGRGSRSTEKSIDRAYEQALRKWRPGA